MKIFIAIFAAIQILGLILMLIAIRRAPEGEETQQGFKYK